MILVGNWKVELDFRVLAPTSMYAGFFKGVLSETTVSPLIIFLCLLLTDPV